MSDVPLDPATLEALRSVLLGDTPPEIEDETWAQMLRDMFETQRGVELHGDLTADDLVPSDWPQADATSDTDFPTPTDVGEDSEHDHPSADGPDWDYLHHGDDGGGHDPDGDDGGHESGVDPT